MATKRIDLRNWIAQRENDYMFCTVDTPAVGALSRITLSDSRLLQADAAYWRDADLIVEYAGGTYDQRRVQAYVPTVSGLIGGVLQIDATLSLLPSTNTNFYLHRRFRFEDYNRAINAAIRHAADNGLVAALHTDTSIVATARIWEYTIPTTSNIDRVLDVYYLDDANYNQPIHLSNRNWLIKDQGDVLTLQFRNDSTVPQGKTVRIEGIGALSTLETDGAILQSEVPAEFVVDYACAELRLQKWSGVDPEDSARQATFLRQMAEAKLRAAVRQFPRGRLTKHF